METKLYRSRTNRVLAGVCGGLGEYLGIDALIVRILFVFLGFHLGLGFLIYLVLALVIPEAPGGVNKPIKPVKDPLNAHDIAPQLRQHSNSWIGIGLIVFGTLWLLDNLNESYLLIPQVHFRELWIPILVMLAGLWLISRRPR